MGERRERVCPVENAGSLDGILRKWIHNPRKILRKYIKEGMTVLDIGCGPGFFSIEMAKMVGNKGKVIAADLQEGMLNIIRKKIKGKKIEKIIQLHKCEINKIKVNKKIDFILAFYVVHEIPNKQNFFKKVKSILKSEGTILFIEPKFHVSEEDFRKSIKIAQEAGLKPLKTKKIFLSRSILLKKK